MRKVKSVFHMRKELVIPDTIHLTHAVPQKSATFMFLPFVSVLLCSISISFRQPAHRWLSSTDLDRPHQAVAGWQHPPSPCCTARGGRDQLSSPEERGQD